MSRLHNTLYLIIISSFLLSFQPVLACSPNSGSLVWEGMVAPLESKPIALDKLQANSQLSARFPLEMLQDSVLKSPKTGEIVLQELAFNAEEQQYLLQLTLVQWPIWDQVRFRLTFPTENTLRLQLQDNWLPTDLIMSRLEQKLKGNLDAIPLEIKRQGQQLELRMLEGPIHLSQGVSADHFGIKALITREGNLELNFAAETEGLAQNSKQNARENLVLFETTSCITSLDAMQGEVKASIDLDLNPDDISALGSEQLSTFLQAVSGGVNLQGTFSGSLIPFDLKSEGSLQINFEQLQAEGKPYHTIQSVPFIWRYSSPDHFKIYPEFAQHHHHPAQFSNNNLQLFIDGPEYFKELKIALSEARESIDQEIFSFYDGETTREIARLMLLKAMGLREQRPGYLEVDLFAPNGARVFLLHNHKYSQKGADHVAQIFTQVRQEIFAELEAAEQSLEIYQKRLENQFQIAHLSQGVMKTDHRKMLVIDGQTAYVGGLNMADHYLSSDGFHDLMIRVQGPAVRAMHDEFIENWQQIKPEPSVRWNHKRPDILKTDLLGLQTSSIAVLTTDDDHPEMIETHLLDLITSAQKVIRLEHAYIYHEPIEEALRQALQRGVHLEIVFSERNDESLFELLNPVSVYDLMRTAPDQVKVWLYQGKGGEYGYMAHTKYLSVDGKAAIVGSANLIPRSLHSPFWSEGKPLLFNEEISLYIRDEKFVNLLDRELLEFDIKKFSRQASEADLKQLIERRGGASQLLLERIKGLLS